jgi:hypothetical protein
MWVVLSMRRDMNVCTPWGDTAISMEWAQGMIGVLPVFDTKENAEAYSDGVASVVEVSETH